MAKTHIIKQPSTMTMLRRLIERLPSTTEKATMKRQEHTPRLLTSIPAKPMKLPKQRIRNPRSKSSRDQIWFLN